MNVTLDSAGKYTADTVAHFAAMQGCSPEDFRRRWIIQSSGAYWIHGPRGYSRPVRISDLQVAMRDLLHCATNIPNGVKLVAKKKDKVTGTYVDACRENADILHDHSTVATKVTSSMSISHSYFDPKTSTFFEKVCPLRPITPQFDERVDTWLRLLGGDRAEKLLDWVATAPQVDKATCAVYLHGMRDTGKTLFALGMARLWSEGPTDMGEVIADFNSAIADCPLILADERLPRNLDSGTLRSFIGKSIHTLRRKGLPASNIAGCLRCVISANNQDLMKFNREDFQREDVEAIASRVLYIPVSPAAKEYLDTLGGASGGTSDWVKGDRIAAHALYLAANRPVQPGKRFLVEGTVETFHKRLATNGDIRELVVEWVCKAITRKEWIHAHPHENPGIRFGHGKLYVNSAFVNHTWENTMSDRQIPTTSKIGRALTPISTGTKKFTVTTKLAKHPARRAFYEIDVSHVYRVAEDLQVGVEDTYRDLIEKKEWNWSSSDDGDDEVPAQNDADALIDATLPPTPPAQTN